MRKAWTEREEIYLQKYYTRQPICKTATKLDRSVNSVKRKAQKLGLNSYIDNFGAKTIAKCFNSDVSVVIRWINKFGLPAKTINYSNKTRYNINVEQFWKWAELHKDVVNWSKYEISSLIPEPEWVSEEKRNYKLKNHRKSITSDDRRKINQLLRMSDKTYAEISEEVGRTTNSIRHIMREIVSA